MTPVKFSKLLKQMEHLTDKQFQELQKRLSEEEPAQRIIRELEQCLIDHPEDSVAIITSYTISDILNVITTKRNRLTCSGDCCDRTNKVPYSLC